MKPIAVYYEHPTWFAPLFDELDRRGVNYVKLHAAEHFHDPACREPAYSLVVNRVSAFPSGGSHPEIVLYVRDFLAYLDSIGTPVINGHAAFALGASKAQQLDLLARLGLRYPRARVIHHPSQALSAADGLTYPVVVKPNIGGSGAGILRFDAPAELAAAAADGALDLGIDHTALVQEYLTARDREIIRVEVMDGRFLYALRLPVVEDSFNYCPADGCTVDNPTLQMETYQPPEAVVRDAERIVRASGADIGGVEYLVNAADGRVYYYDINPLSNFVANAFAIVGFDPWVCFVDFILARAGATEPS